MTRNEAIKYIRNLLKSREDRRGKTKIDIALEMAIKALEQEPQVSSSENPNKCGKWRHYEGMLYCSKCGAEFYDEIMEYTGNEVPKYCPQCGQPKMQEVWNDN